LGCLLVGDSQVGKTTTILSFCGKMNEPMRYIWNNERSVTLVIRDSPSSGTPRLSSKYKDIDVVICMFSLLSIESLRSVESKWIPEIRKYSRKAKIVLVGTKLDIRLAMTKILPTWQPVIAIHRLFSPSFRIVVRTLLAIQFYGKKRANAKCHLALISKELLCRIISYLPPNTNPQVRSFDQKDRSASRWMRQEIQYAVNMRQRAAESASEFTAASISQMNSLREQNVYNAISYEEGQAVADRHEIKTYIECSAYTSENIALLFSEVVRQTVKTKTPTDECVLQ